MPIKKITIDLPSQSYPIILADGILKDIHKHLDLNRNVLIITDDAIPKEYGQTLKDQCPTAFIATVPQGESSKSFKLFQQLCSVLLAKNFNRHDLIIALGGGVVGDLAGFVASTYMRGIDFVNIPTTTMAQIDSSIGGKTAINLSGIKNVIGTFYQPKAVFIDPSILKTLPPQHFANGLVEAVKAGLIYDKSLFELLENYTPQADLTEIIYKSLLVKKAVVEQDEKESGIRQILNFGHTLGHGIESYFNLQNVLHGEAVALGMLLMLKDSPLKIRVKNCLQKLNIPTKQNYDPEEVYKLVCHDKKTNGDQITIVKVPEIGTAKLATIPLKDLKIYLQQPTVD